MGPCDCRATRDARRAQRGCCSKRDRKLERKRLHERRSYRVASRYFHAPRSPIIGNRRRTGGRAAMPNWGARGVRTGAGRRKCPPPGRDTGARAEVHAEKRNEPSRAADDAPASRRAARGNLSIPAPDGQPRFRAPFIARHGTMAEKKPATAKVTLSSLVLSASLPNFSPDGASRAPVLSGESNNVITRRQQKPEKRPVTARSAQNSPRLSSRALHLPRKTHSSCHLSPTHLQTAGQITRSREGETRSTGPRTTDQTLRTAPMAAIAPTDAVTRRRHLSHCA